MLVNFYDQNIFFNKFWLELPFFFFCFRILWIWPPKLIRMVINITNSKDYQTPSPTQISSFINPRVFRLHNLAPLTEVSFQHRYSQRVSEAKKGLVLYTRPLGNVHCSYKQTYLDFMAKFLLSISYPKHFNHIYHWARYFYPILLEVVLFCRI